MKVVLQHVNFATLKIEDVEVTSIKQGYVLLVSFTPGDTIEMIDKIANKIAKLRVIPDSDGKMNLSVDDISGEVLSLSQFTLYADTKKGNRPSFTNSMEPNEASKMFDIFNEKLKCLDINLKTGIFGGDKQILMEISGPITIIYEL